MNTNQHEIFVTDMENTPATIPLKWKERLKWLAPIGLAMLVVCVGCFMCLTVGLVARGELTTSALGTDVRLWSVNEPNQTGVGLQRSYTVQNHGQTCVHFDVTFLLWKPKLSIDNLAYDNCQ